LVCPNIGVPTAGVKISHVEQDRYAEDAGRYQDVALACFHGARRASTVRGRASTVQKSDAVCTCAG